MLAVRVYTFQFYSSASFQDNQDKSAGYVPSSKSPSPDTGKARNTFADIRLYHEYSTWWNKFLVLFFHGILSQSFVLHFNKANRAEKLG